MDERLRVVLESGIYPEMLLGEMEEICETGYRAKSLTTMKCIARYHEKREMDPQAVNLDDLRRLFKIYSSLNLVGIFVVLIELVASGKLNVIAHRLARSLKSIVLACYNSFHRL